MGLSVTLTGPGLMSHGFVANNYAQSGLAVISFGFITGCSDIWTNAEQSVTTVWTEVVNPNDNLESC